MAQTRAAAWTVVAVLAVGCGTAAAAGAAHSSRDGAQRQQLAAGPHQHAPCGHTAANTAAARPVAARRLLQKKYFLSPDVDNRNCYFYRAQDGDTLASIGEALGVSEAELKDLNKKTIQDLTKIAGRVVLICNVKNFANAEGFKGAPAPAPAAASPASAPLAASGADKGGEKQQDSKAPAPAKSDAPAPAKSDAPSRPPAAQQQAGTGGLNIPILGRTGAVGLPGIGIGRR